jgi:hypothetical protein
MTIQQFWKGLAMLIVSAVLTALGQVPPDYAFLFLAIVSSVLGYVGKNILFITATTTLTKIISGLFVAIGAGIIESIGLIAIEGHIVWVLLLKVVGGIFLTYIVTTFLAPPASESKQIKKLTILKQAA